MKARVSTESRFKTGEMRLRVRQALMVHLRNPLTVALWIALGLSFVGSLSLGSVVLNPLSMMGEHVDPMVRLVLWEIRLPRSILAATVGFSLGIAGAAMQGYTRNPLADPGVLGVTTGSAMGAVLTFTLGWASFLPLALPIGGIGGGLLVLLMVMLLSGKDAGVHVMILAGIAVSSLAGAVISLTLNLSPNPHAGMDIVFWLMGSLSDRSLHHVALAVPLMAVGWIMLLMCRRGLTALSLGEETATSLGCSMRWLRRLIVIGSAMAVGPAIAVTGSIGFVGLIVPHLMRPLVGSDPGRLLMVSGLGGSVLLLWADMIVKVLVFNQELRLGVVTALLGAPFFLHLLIRIRREVP